MRYIVGILSLAVVILSVLLLTPSKAERAAVKRDWYHLYKAQTPYETSTVCMEGVVYLRYDRSIAPKYLPGKAVPETCQWPK